MGKFKIEWNEDKKITTTAPKRNWDVRITLNKCGRDNQMVVRFGFLNQAVKTFGNKPYIEMSKIANDRIYFRLFDNKANSNTVKLCKNKGKNPGLYTSFKPSKEQDKLYRARWINGTYMLHYDEDNKLYFIEAPVII